LDAVAEQHERIKEVGEEPDCAALKKKINALANQIVDDYRQRDKEYDQRTEHGVKQGAVLLGPIRKSDPKPE
jgi:predicted secreted Zn-dependent protease